MLNWWNFRVENCIDPLGCVVPRWTAYVAGLGCLPGTSLGLINGNDSSLDHHSLTPATSQSAPSWGALGATSGHLEATLGHLGANLGSSRVTLGPP